MMRWCKEAGLTDIHIWSVETVLRFARASPGVAKATANVNEPRVKALRAIA